MCSSALVTPPELFNLRDVVAAGLQNAAKELSIMVDKEIEVSSPSLGTVRIERVPELIGQIDEMFPETESLELIVERLDQKRG